MPFYKTIRWKLSLINIGIILFIVITIGLFSYYETSRTIEKDVEHFSSLILKQANLNLDRYYQDYIQALMQIGTSEEFERWSRLDEEEAYEQYVLARRLKESYILPITFRHPEILSVSLQSVKGNAVHHTVQFGLDKDYSIDEQWLSEIGSYNRISTRVSFSEDYLDNGKRMNLPVMSLIKRFGIFVSGYVKIDISLEPAQQILAEMKLGKSVIGLIADADGTIMVHPDERLIMSKLELDIVRQMHHGSGSFMREATHEMVVYDTNQSIGWRTIAIIPYEDFAGSIGKVRDMTILTALIGALIAMTLIIWVTTSMTRRITKLRHTIKQTQIGNFQQRVQVDGDDELSDLSAAYNRMLGELETSIQKATESKLLEQRAIISALQSQIHSHFLYNTLESINSMAHLANQREIELVTVSLSRMLRYTSNYQVSLVTVREEIQHLNDYLQICQIRFGEDLTYGVEVEEGCLDVPCLKAILQPIAENALKHGMEQTGEPLHIEVRVCWHPETDGIEMLVIDTGQGFAQDVVASLNRRLKSTVHGRQYNELSKVGLLNVNYRLKMHYSTEHAAAGIVVSNRLEEGHGAVVAVRFPSKSDDS